MPVVMGLDIGGANTKACWLEIKDGQVIRVHGESIYYEVWRDPEGLYGVLERLKGQAWRFGSGRAPGAVGLTMTAELCDVFTSKVQGVRLILAAARQVFTGTPVYVWTLNGDFVSLAGAEEQPMEAAAANWLASATALARSSRVKDTTALLVDMGSTTTDILPLSRGRVEVYGRTDVERLERGELVYTGIIRTPVNTITGSVFINGRPCRVTGEYFAITADVYRFLGYIREEDYVAAVPDNGARTPGGCARRLARVVASEPEVLGWSGIYAVARYIVEKQIQQVTEAIWQVLSRSRGTNGIWCPASGHRMLPRQGEEGGSRRFLGKEPPQMGPPGGRETGPGLTPEGQEPAKGWPPGWPRRLIMAGQGIFLLEQIAGRLGWEAIPWWELAPGSQGEIIDNGRWERYALTAYAVAWLLASQLET
ncbi:hydantoinase/oxoprolinase family protein [Moorella sulfitireducens]|uniref:hydantoinase/oxoprolinase family protein n=1 Tax=Neomoorella sulfitireducens TaxID=2972948 RepID=UPI0021ABB0FC|nr:hydantoinase/oxoprolinase family protein [Moorella sulfitireducens]